MGAASKQCPSIIFYLLRVARNITKVSFLFIQVLYKCTTETGLGLFSLSSEAHYIIHNHMSTAF